MIQARAWRASSSEGAHGRLGRARAAVAVVAGRAAGAAARRLHLGAGTSLPGLVAARLDPEIVAHLGAQLRWGSAVVTGTNGKTTTSGLLAYVLRDAGLRVWRNREGANLLRGVAAALVIRAEPNGCLRRGGNAAAVFEVDEAAMVQVVAALRPTVVVVTNLFRDQLDRYGEVDTVAERWRMALSALPPSTLLALNADDPTVASLGDVAAGKVLYFGVEDVLSEPARPPYAGNEVIDTRTCPRCRAPLTYAQRYYSHIGHWACLACGYARPTPAVRARSAQSAGLDTTRFQLETPAGAVEVAINLPGLYNVYNALAAACAGHLMGAPLEPIARALSRFTPAFGRAERIEVDGRGVRLLLAKNPTGLNEVLRALSASTEAAQGSERHHLLLLLNDHLADGEDVSWIWDADFEQIATLARSVVVSGTRAADLAVRLKYAGVGRSGTVSRLAHPNGAGQAEMSGVKPAAEPPAPLPVTIEPDVARALDAALANVGAGETLYVVPTYTAMLAVRAELERRGYARPYWQTADA